MPVLSRRLEQRISCPTLGIQAPPAVPVIRDELASTAKNKAYPRRPLIPARQVGILNRTVLVG